jgi:hypothetical protein
VDLSADGKVLDISPKPVLRPGALGIFDDHSVLISSIVRAGDTQFLHYMGWNLALIVLSKNAIGLAISETGAPFERWSAFPVVALDEQDPYSISCLWVLHDERKCPMWYGKNLRWKQKIQNVDGIPHIVRSAESSDAIHSEEQDRVATDTNGCGDTAAARPCVVHDPELYRMWFCARGSKYRIYCAISQDGLTWRQLVFKTKTSTFRPTVRIRI